MALCNFLYTEYLVLPIFCQSDKGALAELENLADKETQVNQLSQSTYLARKLL